MRPELRDLILSCSEPFSCQLGEKELEQFSRYLDLILEYNQKLNLTGISDEKGIVVKHFIDSLAGHQFLKNNWFVADFGAGMGCPGIPLKILRPSLKLILLESNQKKSAFINQAIRNLKLENARAVAQRAEDKNFQTSLSGQLNAVLARALGKLDLILKLAQPYLKNGGRVIAYKGPQAEAELEAAKDVIVKLGFRQERIYDYELALEMGNRKLVMMKKK